MPLNLSFPHNYVFAYCDGWVLYSVLNPNIPDNRREKEPNCFSVGGYAEFKQLGTVVLMEEVCIYFAMHFRILFHVFLC